MTDWTKGYLFGCMMTFMLSGIAVYKTCAADKFDEPSTKSYATSITFSDSPDHVVGRIEWGEGALRFSGNADDAARMFFNGPLKKLIDRYLEDHCSDHGKVPE
jgi:hypothetical protein